MPWQRYVADVGGEYHPETGIPFYDEVFATVPRQSGKTTLMWAWNIDRALNWDRPQRAVWTGQTGADARKKWFKELIPELEASRLSLAIARVMRGKGDEAVIFKTGSRTDLMPTAPESGHGETIHLVTLDEVWKDTDTRREQAYSPAMITVPDKQQLTTSTAGHAGSVLYNQKRRLGRAGVGEDNGRGLASFEWSAPNDGVEWDHTDPDIWPTYHPGYGHSTTQRALEGELRKFADNPDEYRRAYGNIPSGKATGGMFPPAVWDRVVDPGAEPDTAGPFAFGVAVSQDRDSAAVAVCDANGVVELVRHDRGTGWVIDEANRLSANRWPVGLDKGGPAGALADNITQCHSDYQLGASDMMQACGAFFDAVVENRGITIRQDDTLDLAAAGVIRRDVGDRFVWSRKASSGEVVALEAATIAWWTARTQTPPALYVGFS